MSVLPRPVSGARWALICAAPAPLALLGWWRGAEIDVAPLGALIPALGATLTLTLAGVLLPRRPLLAKAGGVLGLLGLLAVAAPALADSPALALLVSLVVVLSLVLFQRGTAAARARSRLSRSELHRPAARAAGATAMTLWLLSTFAGAPKPSDVLGLVALGGSALVAFTLLLVWALAHWREYRARASLLALSLAIVAAYLALAGITPVAIVDSIASVVVVGQIVLPSQPGERSLADLFLGHPARLLVLTFALLTVVGTVLLALPKASSGLTPLALGDAAFTSVSAVCVTGLSVIDVGSALSPLGQAILLALIQAGGLGIMTFSTAAMKLFSQRISLRHEGAMAQLFSSEDRSRVFASTWVLVRFTFAVEALGALTLWLSLLRAGHDPGAAVWEAIFTSISAFCNAGFTLTSDSLVSLQSEPLVLHTVALLIILGGLSPAIVLALPDFVRRRPIPVSARLALITTAILLALGFVAFLAFEWSGALDRLSPFDKLNNAWFQSVTLRTAGFNSIDIIGLQPSTLLIMIALMLVGGSPGGTAGGIKTTTLSVIFLGVVATVRGHPTISAGRRQISTRSFHKAAAVTAVFLFVAFAAVLALLLTQDMALRVAAFESVSALGTVGLSIGGTAKADEIGRGILMACMFIGRVGPLTLLVFLSKGRSTSDAWQRPETEIEIA